MKQGIIICCLLFLSQISYASCNFQGLWVYPKSTTIEQNGHILLQGYATSQQIIKGLNKEYPIYLLQADGRKIGLKVKETHIGRFRYTQAYLQPEEKLMAGEEYTLIIENLEEHDQHLLERRGENGEYEGIKWLAKGGTDTTLPKLHKQPAFVESQVFEYGCGPSVNAVFNVAAKDNKSEIWVKTELLDIATNETTIHFLPLEGNKLEVGHGMCGGAFGYVGNTNYKIRFMVYDASGNHTKDWTAWLEFSSPWDA